MTEKMTVHLNGNPIYDIVMSTSFSRLPEELEILKLAQRKICIVTDTNVENLYLKEVEQILSGCCKSLIHFVFPAGESSKHLETVKQLYETLIFQCFDRNDLLVALGGGVVGDLCGYAAATYLRGVDFVQIPTTLLSQVDSSIGGKTGVDFDSYKNMVGAFHMPRLVYTNVSTLHTLPEEQFTSGMGEIIKHGLIKDASYYKWLEENQQDILDRNLDICMEMIQRSNEIKRKVVEEDPKEQGERALLNFGHTLGHGIEKLMDFQMLHGHCVGIGVLAAAYMSAERGNLTGEEAEAVRKMLLSFHMPVSIEGLELDSVIEATKRDKKMDGDVIKFILLNKIGDAYIDCQVTKEDMAKGLSYVLKERR